MEKAWKAYLRIRNVVLKNRIMTTPAPPHCLQGPENFPADAFRNHYSNLAKNVAIVSLDDHFGQYPIIYRDVTDMHSGSFNHHADHIWQDIPSVHNYVNRLIEDIHCEGALVRYVGTTGGGGGMMGGGGAPGGGGAMLQGQAPGRGGAPGGEGRGGAARIASVSQTTISRTHGPWYDTCTVSPEWATPMYKLKNIPPHINSQKGLSLHKRQFFYMLISIYLIPIL